MKKAFIACLLGLVFATNFLLVVGETEEGFEECRAFCGSSFYLENDMETVGECNEGDLVWSEGPINNYGEKQIRFCVKCFCGKAVD